MGEKSVGEGATVVNYAARRHPLGCPWRCGQTMADTAHARARAPTEVTSHGDSSRNNLHAMQPVMR